MFTVWHALSNIDRVRIAAGAPGQEYAFQVGVGREYGGLRVSYPGAQGEKSSARVLPSKWASFPTMSVGETAEMPLIADQAFKDLTSCVGFDSEGMRFVPESR